MTTVAEARDRLSSIEARLVALRSRVPISEHEIDLRRTRRLVLIFGGHFNLTKQANIIGDFFLAMIAGQSPFSLDLTEIAGLTSVSLSLEDTTTLWEHLPRVRPA